MLAHETVSEREEETKCVWRTLRIPFFFEKLSDSIFCTVKFTLFFKIGNDEIQILKSFVNTAIYTYIKRWIRAKFHVELIRIG